MRRRASIGSLMITALSLVGAAMLAEPAVRGEGAVLAAVPATAWQFQVCTCDAWCTGCCYTNYCCDVPAGCM